MEKKNISEADFSNYYFDDSDFRETVNYFGLKYKYCLGQIFDASISKIEEFDDNEKLLISSFGCKMKTVIFDQLKFDQLGLPGDYIYFVLNNKKDIVLAGAFKENSHIIISFIEANLIEIYHWDSNIINIKHLVGHTDSVIRLCVVGDDYLLSGSRDATIKYWKISTLECIRTFVGHKGFVTSVKFLNTSTMFVSGSDDTTLKLWDLESGECLKTFIGHKNVIFDIQETKNGEIVSLDMNGMLKFWNIETATCMLSISSETNDRWSCFRILQSRKLVTGFQTGKIQIWSNELILFDFREKICQTKKGCNILEKAEFLAFTLRVVNTSLRVKAEFLAFTLRVVNTSLRYTKKWSIPAQPQLLSLLSLSIVVLVMSRYGKNDAKKLVAQSGTNFNLPKKEEFVLFVFKFHNTGKISILSIFDINKRQKLIN
ncbi:Fis family transcriptional regulator [Brachionus plicatilis]|uniref:Fis family transcriptional regulator n=1 Tax=Brachionus plicatilis TaxID=10195 RepID=A0A3M7SAL5_BRAPC|nr:Fis family transcriptional regulator [Brachionus plicatilis]